MVEKRKPSNDSALAGDSFKGSDSAEKLPDRISRYGKAKSRAMENCNWLTEYSKSLEGLCSTISDSDEITPMDSAELAEVEKLKTTVESCSNWMVFHHYYTVDKIRLARGSFCKKHLMCLCAPSGEAQSL